MAYQKDIYNNYFYIISIIFCVLCSGVVNASANFTWSIIEEQKVLKNLLVSGKFYNSSALVLNNINNIIRDRPQEAKAVYHNAVLLVQYAPDNGVRSVYFARECDTGLCLHFSYSLPKGYKFYKNQQVSKSICLQNPALSKIGGPTTMPLMSPGALSALLTCVEDGKVIRYALTGGAEIDLASFIKGKSL